MPAFGFRGSNWRWYEYDVWGNKKDGYHVNDVFRTDDYVRIPDPILTDDDKLIAYLKKIGFLKKKVRNSLIGLDGDENTIYLSYKDKPEGEFRRE